MSRPESHERFAAAVTDLTVSGDVVAKSQRGGATVIVDLSDREETFSLRNIFCIAEDYGVEPTDGEVMGSGAMLLRFVDREDAALREYRSYDEDLAFMQAAQLVKKRRARR